MGLDPFYSLRVLWNEELYRINLPEVVPRVEIPVYFIVGKKDIISPPDLSKIFFDQLEAPAGKFYHIFENSGHEPDITESGLFYALVKNQILNINL
jgi:pimeloyl-ACP methyl ester carboxylesterase